VTLVSYAQNGEDVVLARAFGSDYAGFYIDVGASDPVVDSVTKHFYDHGWHGINVEPAALALQALREARPRDINLGVGLGAQPGELTFYELPKEMTGCSTFSAELAAEYRREGWESTVRAVPIMTLASVCEEHAARRTIDFLKIDVEGNEADVLAGADLERFRPRILVVEATAPGTPKATHEAWEAEVLAAAYEFALFDGLNRFYVRSEDRELASVVGVPANTFDDYVPFRVTRWQKEVQEARTGFEEAKAARARLWEDLESTREELESTREELARSQRRLRDAQAELLATRAALIGKLQTPA
jgi:FkbM family methyltransferase